MFSRLALLYLIILPVTAIADSFVGDFAGQLEGQALRLSISDSQDGRYAGSMMTDDEQLPLVGERHNDMLVGHINDGGDIIGFVAAVRGNSIVFQFDSGSRRFNIPRQRKLNNQADR